VHSLDELKARIPEAHVVVVSMMWRATSSSPSRVICKFIQSISAGLDQYDRDLIRQGGIRLASAAGVNAEAVAQHAMALILALKRQLHTGRDNRPPKCGVA
jgi:phosphoglycerate dehydrogenase-like enzyme